MRIPFLALVVVIVVLALGLVSATGDPAPQQAGANHGLALKLPGLDRAAPHVATAMSPRQQAPLPFCGQCTSDSDCGTSHKCCGPSNCLECFRVDTCP
jgi:hypothetical protein